MPLIQSITQSYRNPQLVFRQMWVAGVVESKSLALVMGASAAGFISALPELARRAHLESLDLQQLMGGALLGWIFMAPLMFYCLALVLYWILGLFFENNHSGANARYCFLVIGCCRSCVVAAWIGRWVYRTKCAKTNNWRRLDRGRFANLCSWRSFDHRKHLI